MKPNKACISKRVRFAILERDNFTCRYCGRQSDAVKLEIDHLTPVSQGGTNDESNLFTSCFDCNRGKAAKTIPRRLQTRVTGYG
jgi:5-methylcytosine-specific restriction endonuclease McrA